MAASAQHVDLLALCLTDGISGSGWQVLAREASTHGLDDLLDGVVHESGPAARRVSTALVAGRDSIEDRQEAALRALESGEEVGAWVTTVLDDAYPANLREIRNKPPFLFVQGTLTADDDTSLAIVGTRTCSEEGRSLAARAAGELARRDVTVISGLARGIDTAAHEAALEAGGRTVAVLGHGIAHPVYPPENDQLASRIAASGAVVSQFLPLQPPSRRTFPIRNVVTSGLSRGTLVIEASSTSGAKNQARQAAEHGKDVYLVHHLVTREEWARSFVASGRGVEVENLADIMSRLRTSKSDTDLEAAQMTLALS